MGVKNTKFAEDSWQEEAKFSLLKYLLGFIRGFEKKYGKPIYDYDWKYSKIVEERSKEYLGSGDRITEFLNNNLIPNGDKKAYVKLSDLYRTFTERSDFYKNAKSSVKDKYTKNKFFHLISESKSFYSYYRDSKEVRVNGERQNIGKVLVNHTIKTDEQIKNENDPKQKYQIDSDEDCISSEDESLDSDCDNNIELISMSDSDGD